MAVRLRTHSQNLTADALWMALLRDPHFHTRSCVSNPGAAISAQSVAANTIICASPGQCKRKMFDNRRFLEVDYITAILLIYFTLNVMASSDGTGLLK